jgi:DnaJ-domain-containing protein 1
MSEPIRPATNTQAFYEDYHEVARNRGRTAYNVRDRVQFSPEALEKLKTVRVEESKISQHTNSIEDTELQESLNILKLQSGQSGATPDQIRKAYLEAIKRYHPDNYSTLPPEFQKLAEEKTKEINSAYYRLKNSRIQWT